MTDPYVFFDAVGDEAKFQRNLDALMASVHRFIDMAAIDVVPTSQYRMFSGEPFLQSSEERRVGKECVSTCRSRWAPHQSKQNIQLIEQSCTSSTTSQ